MEFIWSVVAISQTTDDFLGPSMKTLRRTSNQDQVGLSPEPVSVYLPLQRTPMCVAAVIVCQALSISKRYNRSHLDFVRAPTAALAHQSGQTLRANVSLVIIGRSPSFYHTVTVCIAALENCNTSYSESLCSKRDCLQYEIHMNASKPFSKRLEKNDLPGKLSPSSCRRGNGLLRSACGSILPPPLLLRGQVKAEHQNPSFNN